MYTSGIPIISYDSNALHSCYTGATRRFVCFAANLASRRDTFWACFSVWSLMSVMRPTSVSTTPASSIPITNPISKLYWGHNAVRKVRVSMSWNSNMQTT